MNRVEEQQLIQQAQEGSSEAFAVLYREHVQQIYRYIYYRTNDKHLAEDLTADVFTKAIEGLSRYVDKGKPFISWLYRIAHARVIDHYRRQDRRPTATDVEDANLSVTPDMDATMLKQHASNALLTAIQSLTDEQQQVIILRFVDGLSTEAVAEQLGKKGNAIKAMQFRAVRSMASFLERSGFDAESILAGLF